MSKQTTVGKATSVSPAAAGDHTQAQEEAPGPGQTQPLTPACAFAPENQRPCLDLCPSGLWADKWVLFQP